METHITGHFLELGWGPAVLRSPERGSIVFIEQDGMLFWVTFPQSPRSTESQGFRRWWSNVVPLAGKREVQTEQRASHILRGHGSWTGGEVNQVGRR